jgi:hypothetical protein
MPTVDRWGAISEAQVPIFFISPIELKDRGRLEGQAVCYVPLIVRFVRWPHSSQTYETSTRPGAKTTGVVRTNRIPDLQMGQSGAAKTKLGRTSVADGT